MAEETVRKQVIVNADDFGYSDERNKGIVESFKFGVVSSVSLLVNGSSAQQAIQLAQVNEMPLGLHLNLTEGLSIRKVKNTLTDDSGFFRGKMGFREALRDGGIDKLEIETEITAQLEWFLENVGSPPTHVDGHQHVHVLPQVSRILASILKNVGVLKTRIPTELNLERCSWISSARKTFFASVINDAKEARQLFLSYGIRCPCGFIGLRTMGKDMTFTRIQQCLREAFSRQEGDDVDESPYEMQERTGQVNPINPTCLRTKTCEFMAHPGYKSTAGRGGCGQGPDGFACSDDREHELQLLTSQSLKDFLEKENFNVISFRDL